MNKEPLIKNTQNLANELAKERNRAASERTLMAWIRTCLSLIGFGVGIDRVVNAIYFSLGGTKVSSTHLSRILGLMFIAIGTFALIAATIEHQHELKRIQRGDFTKSSTVSLVLVVALFLSFIGLFAFIAILAKI